MTLHYVYVDSRQRGKQPVNKFIVKLRQPIKNVQKAGLLSFSKGNNSWNVHAGNNSIKWIEIYFDTTDSKYKALSNYFEIQITPGYYGINELLTDIVTKMSTASGRVVTTETETSYGYSLDDNYNVSILASAASTSPSNRYWAFYHEDNSKAFNSSILHAILNFQREDVATSYVIEDDTVAPVASYFRQSKTSLSTTARTLKSRFSYVENQSCLHLASHELVENSQVMIYSDGHSSTAPTHVLETIQVQVNRWSYIHVNKVSNDVHYHNLHNKTISHFDLELLGEHYEQIHEDAESNFKAVFVFETFDEPQTETIQMHKAYNESGYKLAHRIQ